AARVRLARADRGWAQPARILAARRGLCARFSARVRLARRVGAVRAGRGAQRIGSATHGRAWAARAWAARAWARGPTRPLRLRLRRRPPPRRPRRRGPPGAPAGRAARG